MGTCSAPNLSESIRLPQGETTQAAEVVTVTVEAMEVIAEGMEAVVETMETVEVEGMAMSPEVPGMGEIMIEGMIIGDDEIRGWNDCLNCLDDF